MKIENELNQFIGTEHYYDMGIYKKTKATDGVVYLMNSGYSWFVTDSLSVIETENYDEFLVVTLKVKNSKAVMTITDGNGKTYWSQKYGYTDSDDGELMLFWENGVIMLTSER